MRDGQPAFPMAWTERNEHGVEFPMVQSGATLRDVFAWQALPALIARHRADVAWSAVAPTAYEIADAMLRAREI